MQDLKSALDKADGKAPGPNRVEACFIKALPAPVQWLLVHSYRAILRGAPPPMHWRDAHIWLSFKVPGSTRLDDYRPIALGQLDMKLLTGPLTQRITEVLTRHGVVSDWQQGALPGSNTGSPLFMAQRQLQRGRPKYFFSFDARKASDTAPHGALHLILRHLSVPPDVIDLLLFLHTCASEAGSDPRGHLGVTWGVYLCAGKPTLADIILSHPPELTRCDSVIGLAIPATCGHIQYRGTASGDLYIGISGINRVLLS